MRRPGDYFGTRYLSAAQGRFTSADAPFADQHAEDPQSWNLYAYVRNNPLVNIDPTGQDCVYTNNYTTDGTVTVETGNCSQKGGTFVNRTIDTKSLTVRNGSLEFGYSDPNGTAGAHSMGLPAAQSSGLLALQRAGQLAGPVADIGGIGLFYGASAAAGAALYAGGVFAGGELATMGSLGSGGMLTNAQAGSIIGWGTGKLEPQQLRR